MNAEQTEDFELEYEELYEAAGDDPDPINVRMETDAERRLRSMRYWESELVKIEELVLEETERIEVWAKRHRDRIHKRLIWNSQALEAYLFSTDKKTIDLPSGTLRRRKGRSRIDVVLEETFMQWAENNKMEEMIRVKRSPDKKAITAHERIAL